MFVCARTRVYVYMCVCMYMSVYANDLKNYGYICFILEVQLICASLLLQFGFSGSCIMSSCVKPIRQQETDPVVLLHCFDRF